MTLSMYQASIPVFIHHLNNLSGILKKGADFCEAKKIDQSVLLNSRLAVDMLPLTRQVQIVSDTVKAGSARLAGVEVPSFEDNETSFDHLQERINKTIKFIETLKATQIDGKEDSKISYTQRGKENNYIGQPYLLNYVLPNLFFHISIAYAILRHSGVDVGKKDYLGKIQ